MRLHGDAAASLSMVYILAASIGLAAGGLLWTWRPRLARPVLAGAMTAAAILTGLLAYAPAEAWGAMHGAMGFLVGLWYPAFGSALCRRVPVGERGRVIGWMLAFGYLPGQLILLLEPRVDPIVLTGGVALMLAAAGAIPLGVGPFGTGMAGPAALRPWKRLFTFALVAGLAVGIVRVDSPILITALGTGREAELLVPLVAAVLAGVVIDRRGRIPAAVAGVLALGLSLGLGLVIGGGMAELPMRLGTRTGVLMLEAFWATILADLSVGYGPAISFGFGHALALFVVGGGVWLGHLLPGLLTGGLAILALFAATGLLWGLPETGLAGASRAPGPPDLAAALALTAVQPLTNREMEVALLLAKGSSTSEIARELFLTQHTVRAHLHRIYTKTGTASRHELLARVIARVSDRAGA